MSIRVMIVDDQALVRAGFRMIVGSEEGLEVVAEAADGAEAIEAARRERPDVILMDIRMPGMDGVEATRRITAEVEGAHVLVLTTFDLDEYVFESLRAGASGFLLKDVQPERLVEAVRIVAAGEALLAPSVTRKLLDRFARALPEPAPDRARALGTLTERELEVLQLVARGLSNAEIAAQLFVGDATVKSHVSHVLMKLGLRDRVQAVVYAYEAGVVQPGA